MHIERLSNFRLKEAGSEGNQTYIWSSVVKSLSLGVIDRYKEVMHFALSACVALDL